MSKKLVFRYEDKSKWECRTPIVPTDAKVLREEGLDIYYESSTRRVFADEEYKKFDIPIMNDLNQADIIIGVKEVPTDKVLDDKIYMYFSHTIKGQSYNMPMLKKLLEKGCTLIDYEKVTDDKGSRLIFFGKQAGFAGAVDSLWMTGQNLIARGVKNPFQEVKRAMEYKNVDDACQHLKQIGEKIKEDGFPERLTPFVIGIFGYGNVSEGAQFVFDYLPTKYIAPSDLKRMFETKDYDSKSVYISVFYEKDMVQHKTRKTEKFDLQDYYQNGNEYEGITEQYLSYLDLFVNAIYWNEKYPRFLTKAMLKKIFEKAIQPLHIPFYAITDISCDIHGAVEPTYKGTEPGNPCYIYDPITDTYKDGYEGDGVVILAVDILPAEFPYDSSVYFSGVLRDYIPSIMNANYDNTLEEANLPDVIKRAVIVWKGELTEDYKYIEKFL